MELLRLMLADSESAVREKFRQMIPWENLGYEFTAEAGSGTEALKFIDDIQPEVVVTELALPGLGGMDMIKKLYEENPQIRVIIHSEMDSFEYAREALKYNVADYILKSADCSELTNALTSLYATVTAERKEKRRLRNMEAEYEVGILRMRELMRRNTWETAGEEAAISQESVRESLVIQAKTFVEENYQNSDLTAEMVAEQLHISAAYFSTIFKKECGQSYVSYLRELRLKKAFDLLVRTADKTCSIAQRVGYEDANYFSSVFKKHFGIAPSRCREMA